MQLLTFCTNMNATGDRWALNEAPKSFDHVNGPIPPGGCRKKQRYESSVSEHDYILPQPGAYYEVTSVERVEVFNVVANAC